MDGLQFKTLVLQGSLFQGISEAELPDALSFLHAHVKAYQRDEMIFLIGDPMPYAGMVLEGTVALSFLDEGDNNINMNHFIAGSMFGESLACVAETKSPVQMQALTDCRILFLELRSVTEAKNLAAGYQAQLGRNLLRDLARQNVFLNQKVRIMSQRRLRDRLRVFLRQQDMTPDGTIRLRFNRSELAEYLGANRSALSRELSNMQAEGIITLSGHSIRMLDREFIENYQ